MVLILKTDDNWFCYGLAKKLNQFDPCTPLSIAWLSNGFPIGDSSNVSSANACVLIKVHESCVSDHAYFE